jgi:lambda repressor-like predicted transcriptional regulator
MSWQEYLGNSIRKQEDADGWLGFHSRFMQLANEEEEIERVAPKDRLLRAYCDYHEHPRIWSEKGEPEQGFFCLLKEPEMGLWIVSRGVSENFQERFRALAARAGVALGCPKEADAEDFWLHRLFLDLLENNSDQLFAASEEGGVINRVCVASATFCSRLERWTLQEPEHGIPEQHNTQRPPNEIEVSASFDQAENTTSAILTRKARIAEIERILNRPPLTEYRGQPVHGGASWRLRLEEERQHFLITVAEMETELERSTASRAQSSTNSRQGLGSKPTDTTVGNAREAFLSPILKKKGFSVHDWAKTAKVDFHTANNYLRGKTKPHPTNLKKLADALGVEVANLPE